MTLSDGHRIAVYTGVFDPVHLGHLDVTTDAQLPLYEVKANLFKGLAHPLRVRVLEVLSSAPEASVSELLEATGLEPSHLSQHLAVLKRNLLVRGDRRANQVYYRLAYPQIAELLRVARTLLGQILETTERQLVEQAGLPAIPPARRVRARSTAPPPLTSSGPWTCGACGRRWSLRAGVAGPSISGWAASSGYSGGESGRG